MHALHSGLDPSAAVMSTSQPKPDELEDEDADELVVAEEELDEAAPPASVGSDSEEQAATAASTAITMSGQGIFFMRAHIPRLASFAQQSMR